MVQCNFKEYDGVFVELQIKGHAEYNPGNDIVCSAVSALAYTFYGACIDTGINDITMQDKLGDYYCYVDLKKMNDDLKTKVMTIFKAIYAGMKLIENSYKKNVKVKMIKSTF